MRKICSVGLWMLIVAMIGAVPVLAQESQLLNGENLTAVSPLELGEPSDGPDIVAECEAVCKTEQTCGTLPSGIRGDCDRLCRSTALDPAVRSCMAKTEHCAEFADCSDLHQTRAPILAVEVAEQCDKNKRVPCPGVSGGCGFPVNPRPTPSGRERAG